MQNAQKRNACLGEKFWFRKDITTTVSPPEANKCCKGTTNLKECDIYTQLTISEIINGKVCLSLTFDFNTHIPVKTIVAHSCLFVSGGRVPRANTADQQLPERHGRGRWHPLHDPAVFEVHSKESQWRHFNHRVLDKNLCSEPSAIQVNLIWTQLWVFFIVDVNF